MIRHDMKLRLQDDNALHHIDLYCATLHHASPSKKNLDLTEEGLIVIHAGIRAGPRAGFRAGPRLNDSCGL